jgi:hypothetical protein
VPGKISKYSVNGRGFVLTCRNIPLLSLTICFFLPERGSEFIRKRVGPDQRGRDLPRASVGRCLVLRHRSGGEGPRKDHKERRRSKNGGRSAIEPGPRIYKICATVFCYLSQLVPFDNTTR